MSQDAAFSGSLPVSQDKIPTDTRLPLTLPILIGIVGISVFVISQMLIVSGAVIWAIGGYMHLGLIGFAMLVALSSPLLGFGSWKVLTMAIAAERDPANN